MTAVVLPPASGISRKKRFLRLAFAALFAGLLGAGIVLGVRIQRREGEREYSMHAMKSLSVALIDFDNDYGQFPSAATIPAVKENTGTKLSLGTNSSNQLLRQLLATTCKSEKIFYVKTSFGRKPDGRFEDDAHALSSGECGFVYVAGGSSEKNLDAPLLITPPALEKGRFDPAIYGGRALVLFVDNSVRTVSIDASGHAVLNGMDIFDPRQPFWHGKAPDVKWPE